MRNSPYWTIMYIANLSYCLQKFLGEIVCTNLVLSFILFTKQKIRAMILIKKHSRYAGSALLKQ